MITTVNKSNKGLYNELFDAVQNWLYTHGEDGNEVEERAQGALLRYVQVFDEETQEWVDTDEPETITSLEELFTNMEYITKYAPIYTRLPLDEEPFFIDADKRSITVPKDFATNGVSVQGDEVAEILFFKINRFFDATDLSTCDILIQWKSSEIDEETGNPKEGASKPWIKDVVSEPGYLIFGWPISSKITKAPGPVTFSVRFYRLDDLQKLVYSFSTLDQTVVVKPALDYDIEDVVNDIKFVDDVESLIKGRATNSPNTASDLIAEMPTWEDGILDALYNSDYVYNTLERPTGNWKIAHLGIRSGFSTEPITLTIAAVSDDSGVVSYRWTKVDGITNELDEYMHDGVTQYYQVIAYIEDDTTENKRLSNKTYYYLDGDKYRAIPPTTSLDDARAEHETIYQLVSIAIADEVGRYIGAARNKVGKVASDDLTTDTIVFLKPSAPEIGDLVSQNGDVVLTGENIISLGVTEVVLNDEMGLNDEAKGCKATYTWHRRDLGEDTELIDINTAEPELTLTDPELDEGWYSVTITNNLNNETASIDSNEIRITKPAVKLTLSIGEDDDLSLAEAQANGLLVEDTGREANREDDDTVTYQWYYYSSDNHDVELDMAAAERGEYDITSGDTKVEDLDENALTEAILNTVHTNLLKPPIPGYYFCSVTNHYNGTDQVTNSPFYRIVN